jgi:hypothetical protein
MSSFKEGGYHQKYIISKTNGNPVDPEAEYFLLRFDKDPHALKALYAYANSVKEDNPQLACDLGEKIDKHIKLLDYFLPTSINLGEAKCHECLFKYNVPGNTHIGCSKPDSSVKGDPHGIKNGWFIYPILFDPIWMIVKCRHFKEKE